MSGLSGAERMNANNVRAMVVEDQKLMVSTGRLDALDNGRQFYVPVVPVNGQFTRDVWAQALEDMKQAAKDRGTTLDKCSAPPPLMGQKWLTPEQEQAFSAALTEA